MTTLQKTIIIIAAAGALAVGTYQATQVSRLRGQVDTIKREHQQEVASLRNQLQEVQLERDHATNARSTAAATRVGGGKKPDEILRLRGEVSRLRQEKAEIGSSSALSKITANPEASRMLREQQKAGMGMIYGDFAKDMKLEKDQKEKFHDILADHVMDNVTNITTALRDKLTAEEMKRLFAAQDAVLLQNIETLLGTEASAHFQEYTRDLFSTISAKQFKSMLSGTDESKEEKSKQLRQVLLEEVAAALAQAGLPADYQTVPTLNFINIASEEEGERSMKLMESIYDHAAARSSFLNADEVAKLKEFKTLAVNNNRGALALNRSMMMPIGN